MPPAARRNGTQLASGAINGTIALRNERHACQRLVVAGQLSRYQATGPPALYLAPDGDRFLSREATGLKYRRARNKADRAMRRGFKLMQKLQTDHFGPGIGKPPGMSERVFDKLNYQLTKEHIRYMCAGLGKPDPEFWDEEPPPPPKHPPRLPRRDNVVGDQSIYFRDKSDTLKMRAKFEKKFGLTTSTH